MKKLTALFLAVVMMMALALPASAAEITIENAASGTYKAYKVLEVEGSKDAIRYKNDIDAWELLFKIALM